LQALLPLPMVSVAPVAVIVDELLPAPPSVSVVPAAALAVPALDQVVGVELMVPEMACSVPLFVKVEIWIVIVRPVAAAEIRPLLSSVAAEELEMVRSPPLPEARRISPAAPMVTVPAPPNAICTVLVPVPAPSIETSEFST